MRTFKVIALSCNSKRGILNSGETVTEDAFEEREADQLVKDGFLKEVKGPSAPEKKVEGKKEKGLLSSLSQSVGL